METVLVARLVVSNAVEATVSEDGLDSVHDAWAYLLASATIVKDAGTWPVLKAVAQTFR